jgi:glycosyltransferase involved in cell wall biosynthesis
VTRLKVLYLVQHLTMGGAEELLRGIATGLPPERFEVVVGCFTREGIIARELREAGIRVELLPGEPGPRDPNAFWRLLLFVRAERPDVVHTFLLNAGLYGRLAAWLARVPAIYHAEQNVYADRSRRHLAFERFLAPRTTRVVACCRAVADFYASQVGVGRERLEVIYNAVDFAAVAPRPDRERARAELGFGPDDLVLGCLGRLTEQKGHDVLLEAIARFQPRAQRGRLRLLLAGQGPWQARLGEQAAALGLVDQVQLLGIRRDRDTLYAAMDVFVLPSRWEGLSLALAEAAGVGLAVVATDVGGNAEVIDGQPGAWLVPPEDPDALASALSAATAVASHVRCFHRPEVRERFSLETHLRQLEESYLGALTQKPSPPRDLTGPTHIDRPPRSGDGFTPWPHGSGDTLTPRSPLPRWGEGAPVSPAGQRGRGTAAQRQGEGVPPGEGPASKASQGEGSA